MFGSRLQVKPGEVVLREGFVFADLILTEVAKDDSPKMPQAGRFA
jgi:hypothetical protein